MTTPHDQRWHKLKAALASHHPTAGGNEHLATITQEMSEMDQDIGQMAAAMKAQNEHIAAQTEKQSELQARMLELEQRAVAGGFNKSQNSTTPGSNVVSAAVIEADGISAFRAGQKSTGKMRVGTSLRAAVTNPDKGAAGSKGYPTAPVRAPGIQGIPQPRLSLLDVLPVVPVEGSTYEYVQLDGYLNGAAYQVKEGDEKAEGQLPTKLSRAEIATIATWIPASLQVLNDNEQLEDQIGLLMSVGVRQKLEAELLVGDGGPGEILGFIAQAPEAGITTGKPVDRIGLALTDLKAAGWNPNVVVMNPRDWFAIESERADEGDGQYVIGTPRDPAPPSLWGTPVVVTMGMPEGKALILDTTTTALLDRQEVTVEASRMDGDNFRRNLVTILAELRAGLAVYAPSSMRLVSLTPTAP
ncbi:phage major capsid protein [Pseudomonas syringae]|uniref:phage major capsid protein n=1 Tax=Pseudomonas syringae TaxID=317 RepID=UPI001BCABEFA|nr:phage major capsid protein [Pseudomonas syringae]MBS7423896.1 phage major capsid protein [Pseudomonas syringae]QVI81641.1 phage major capsid protein [Pseudomonas syringae]